MRLGAHRPAIPGPPEAAFALGDVVSYSGESATAQCLATGRTVLRARYDASLLGNAILEAEVRALGVHSVMAVPLRARGATLGVAVLVRDRTPDPFDQDDLLLAEEISARAAVAIDNARRYTRERDAAAISSALSSRSGCHVRPPWTRPPAICPPADPKEQGATGST
ncbi:GAF domain-containing protein [Streptomyces ipomoeae]|uniref:GAF domain-containing protein n=1 Tax=Streptomyces ipomoeae TaxID=103232 RepID=UPI0029C0BFB1|nr:GAF domain-containing protein [Streptomyces ipomoeae]